MIPNSGQFNKYSPGIVPEPQLLPRYLARNNSWLQERIELQLHQLALEKKLKKMMPGVNGTPNF